MKRMCMIVMVLFAVSVVTQAQVIQAGITGLDAKTVMVFAKVTSGSVTDQPFSNVVLTLFWETSTGITLGSPSGGFSIGKAGAVTAEGEFSYQKFASTPNVNVTWATNEVVPLFTITLTSGTGPALIELRNPADGGANGDWYIEISGENRTGTGFIPGSIEVDLPVTLTSFAGKVVESGQGVDLAWTTASEVNNYGYTVQRKLEQEETYVDLPEAFIAGHGTTVDAHTYSYRDNTVPASGRYAYRLKQQDLDGSLQYSQAVIVNVSLTAVVEAAPREFQLMQNYPNPFNPATMVKFSVPATGQATVKVYDMVGQEVATLFEGVAEAGRYYAVSFNGAQFASGMYFYRMVTEQKTDVRRMMLVK